MDLFLSLAQKALISTSKAARKARSVSSSIAAPLAKETMILRVPSSSSSPVWSPLRSAEALAAALVAKPGPAAVVLAEELADAEGEGLDAFGAALEVGGVVDSLSLSPREGPAPDCRSGDLP